MIYWCLKKQKRIGPEKAIPCCLKKKKCPFLKMPATLKKLNKLKKIQIKAQHKEQHFGKIKI